MAKSFNYYLPIEQAKGRFYMRKHFTKNFQDITEDRLKEIIKDAKDFRTKHSEEQNKRTTFLRGPVSLYSDVMFYLTNPFINDIYPTFDEKMAFLINVIDPEYKIGHMYTQAPLLTPYELKELKDTKSDSRLDEHKRTHEMLFHQTENLFGCSDSQLIQFSRTYFHRFVLTKELQSNIQANHLKELLDKALVVRSFSKTTDEEFEEANKIVQDLIASQSDITNPNTIAFNILKQNKLLGGNATLKQAFIIFILAFDPELKMLQIYYDESMVPKMEERATEELGFYSQELIRLEQQFHQRFMPEKEISIWQI